MAVHKTGRAGAARRANSPSGPGKQLISIEIQLPVDILELLRDVVYTRFIKHSKSKHTVSTVITDVIARHRQYLEGEAALLRGGPKKHIAAKK